MIPVLYAKDEERFASNGIGRLVDCIRCEVTEERNGIYEVEFEYPVTGKYFSEITLGRIIYVSHDETKIPQPFDIYKRSAEIDGIVTFYASHVSYRLGSSVLQPFTASTCAEAMNSIPENVLDGTNFTFWTDKSVTARFNLQYPQAVRATLSGVTGSILDVYGTGEYEFDRFAVKLYGSRGTNTDVQLRYGKNLTSITAETDASGVYNAVIPFWHSVETGETVMLPNAIVAEGTESIIAPWTNENGDVIKSHQGVDLEFNALKLSTYTLDLTADFTEKPTVAQLRERALKRFTSSEPWLQDENITVDFIQLWQTEEYADVAPLQRLRLCDTAVVLYPQAGVNVRKKVIRVVYDALLERYSSMELGTPRATLSDTIQEVTQETTMLQAASMMQQAVGRATQMITGGLGGYVVINMINDRPSEILIMDSPDIASAVNVIRMNENGIGFSQNGYDGEYSTAWTIDGAFNADFITTGTLSANRIFGGIIRAINGESQWNLDTGYFTNSGTSASGTTRLSLAGGQMYIDYKGPSDEDYSLRGSIRSTSYSDGSLSGIVLKAALGNYAALALATDTDDSDSVFVANGGNYGGLSEKAIINGDCRHIGTTHFNSTLLFDWFAAGVGRENYMQIGKIGSRYQTGVIVKKDGLRLMGETASGTPQLLAEVYTNTASAQFGFIYFYSAVGFRDTIVRGLSKLQTTDSFSPVRVATRQLIITNVDSGGAGTSTNREYILYTIGNAYIVGDVVCESVIQTSDERLKDFQPWDDRYEQIIDTVEPKLFTWKKDEKKRVHVGYSAQEVQAALKDAGIDDSGIVDEDEYLALNYNDLTMLLARKVRKQQKRIDELEERIARLERLINANT